MARGRPTKFTAEVRERILQAVSVGAPLEPAAKSAGISYACLRNWLKKGQKGKDTEFREFAAQVAQAEGRALVKWLAIIDKAAQEGCWSAAAWKAERRFPQHFGRSRVEVTGKDGGAIENKVKQEVSLVTDPARQANILAILSQAGALDPSKLPAPPRSGAPEPDPVEAPAACEPSSP